MENGKYYFIFTFRKESESEQVFVKSKRFKKCWNNHYNANGIYLTLNKLDKKETTSFRRKERGVFKPINFVRNLLDRFSNLERFLITIRVH